ncbi:SMP-30/gluconolactonase/LRE family protein [Alsobacter sp. SYSU BS001988]
MAEIECLIQVRDQLGETPLWCDQTQTIWWLDIERPRVQALEWATKRHRVFPLQATWAGGLAFAKDGRLLVALDNSLWFMDRESGALERFIEVEAEGRGTRLNDGRCDPTGRLWIGTMDERFVEPLGTLYRIEPSGRSTPMFDGIQVANSITTSPDGRVLYFADTRRFVIWAFDIDADGELSDRRMFADYTGGKGRPDGSCVDAEGYLWNAVFAGGRVVRYAPDGRVDRTIELPVTNPTCVCFGGPDLDRLIVTTATKMITHEVLGREPLAGGLLSVTVGVRGRPEFTFG